MARRTSSWPRPGRCAIATGYRPSSSRSGPTLARDVAVARALREALGDDLELYPDANQHYWAAYPERFLERTRDCSLR